MTTIAVSLVAIVAIAAFARQYTWRVKALLLAVGVAMIISLMR